MGDLLSVEVTPKSLKEFREKRGLSMSKAADKVGVHRSTWLAWEKDGSQPSGENLTRLRSLLMKDLDLQEVQEIWPGLYKLKLELDLNQQSYMNERTERLFNPDGVFGSAKSIDTLHGIFHPQLVDQPAQFLEGAAPANRYNVRKLRKWFFNYFFDVEVESEVSSGAVALVRMTEFLAGAAGYAVGKLKYAVHRKDAEKWQDAAEALFVDLVAMKTRLQQKTRKKGNIRWQRAFWSKFALGCCVAQGELLCPSVSDSEDLVVRGLIRGTRHVDTVTSELTKQDFCTEIHSLVFEATNRLSEAGKAIDRESIIAQLDDMDKSTEALEHTVRTVDLGSDEDFLLHVKRVKVTALLRELLSEIAALSNRTDEISNLERMEESLREMISAVKSISQGDRDE